MVNGEAVYTCDDAGGLPTQQGIVYVCNATSGAQARAGEGGSERRQAQRGWGGGGGGGYAASRLQGRGSGAVAAEVAWRLLGALPPTCRPHSAFSVPAALSFLRARPHSAFSVHGGRTRPVGFRLGATGLVDPGRVRLTGRVRGAQVAVDSSTLQATEL